MSHLLPPEILFTAGGAMQIMKNNFNICSETLFMLAVRFYKAVLHLKTIRFRILPGKVLIIHQLNLQAGPLTWRGNLDPRGLTALPVIF